MPKTKVLYETLARAKAMQRDTESIYKELSKGKNKNPARTDFSDVIICLSKAQARLIDAILTTDPRESDTLARLGYIGPIDHAEFIRKTFGVSTVAALKIAENAVRPRRN